jgi:predicted amidohydrolase
MTHRIALWQGPSPAGDVADALATATRMIAAAGAAGAKVLVLPETWLQGYNQDTLPETALPRDGNWTAALATACAAANCAVVIGYAERDGAKVYNAALALDAAGMQIAHYRKIQLYGPREAALYTPGDSYSVFDLNGIRTALLICYDIEFAPHVATLAARGVRLILVPTANMLPFTHVAAATVPAMAANHGLSIAYANYCGTEDNLTYAGGSVIAGPHGEVLAQAGPTPTLLIADLPAADPARLSTQAKDYRAIR